jgi:hypothetical protein
MWGRSIGAEGPHVHDLQHTESLRRVTASVSGLLREHTHVRKASSRCLRRCPRVTVIARGRPRNRARDGHDHCPAFRVTLEAGRAGMDTERAIPGPGLSLATRTHARLYSDAVVSPAWRALVCRWLLGDYPS